MQIRSAQRSAERWPKGGKKVAIIGGGFTGLAAAQSLLELGYSVTLFEQKSSLGGLAAGFKEELWSCSLENFYHHWFQTDTFVFRYAKKWGLSSGLQFHAPSTVMQLRNGSFGKLDSPLALLRYPDLSVLQRLRMGVVLAWLRQQSNWSALEKETAEKWCRKWMGDCGFEAIWQPLLEGKFGTQFASQVNMAWLWARLACRTQKLGTFEGGFARFCNLAGEAMQKIGLKIELSADLKSVSKSDQGWEVNNQGGDNEFFDAIVVAASPLALTKLIPASTPKKISPFLGAQVVILSLAEGLGPHYWYSLRKDDKQWFLALIEHTNFVPARFFNNEKIIYLADYVQLESSDWQRSDEQLVEAAMRTCQMVNPKFARSNVLKSWVFRETYAQPVPLPEHSLHLPSFSPLGTGEHGEGLFHASMGHVYPWDRGTNFALELGHQVATFCHEYLIHKAMPKPR